MCVYAQCMRRRQVREAISILDLDVAVFPCPKGGVTWRPKAVELGGKAQASGQRGVGGRCAVCD